MRTECPLCGKDVAATLSQPGKRTKLTHPVYARHRGPRSRIEWCATSGESVVANPEDLAARFDAHAKVADCNADWMREMAAKRNDGKPPSFDAGYRDALAATKYRAVAEGIRQRNKGQVPS